MTFGQILSVLRARWKIATLVFVLTVGITLIVSLVLPKQYTATASVVLDVKPDPVTAMLYAGMVSPAFMATQADIIQSDRVAYRVVRNLKLADSPQVRQQWLDETGGEGSIEVWLAATFSKKLNVQPSRDSNVINVSYSAPDPRFAAGLANAFVQAYIDTSLELRVDPAKQYSSFFDKQGKEARDALEKAQSRLSAFQREKGITATDERLDVETARLNDLSSQLVMIQAIAAESNSRQGQARGSSADQMQEVLSNPVINGLKSQLSVQEARLKELNARYGSAHPQIVELKANIAELKTSIADETRRVTGGVGVTGTINRAREAQVRDALAAQRAKVLNLKQVRDEGQVLARDVENAQRSYDTLMARSMQTGLESQTTQSNVNVLTQAVPPIEASSPRVFLNLALSIFLGALLAIGTAVVLEINDRRVRSTDDVFSTLGLPVLGVMPKPGAKLKLGHRHLPAMQQRLMAALPQPAKGA
ncbi:MAG TPA: chain length determinant protein EpsF [Burkholderiaceae bacterium]|jgi:chain length determinant protein EpsF|nr:chain length determinant protein EpsF [Burkholderiaceae bacterium]